MIVDHRTYTLHPGKTNEYLETYEKHGFAIQTKHLGQPVGYFFSEIGPMNQIVHIWKYQSLAERDERRAKMTADPGWAAYVKLVQPLILLQETKILKAAKFMPQA